MLEGNALTFSYNPILDFFTYQQQMAIERYERLRMEDCFDKGSNSSSKSAIPPAAYYRPKMSPEIMEIYKEGAIQVDHSMIRPDDVEVYLRIILDHNKKTRPIRRLSQCIKWLPMSYGREIFMMSQHSMKEVFNEILALSEAEKEKIKAQMKIDLTAEGMLEKDAEGAINKIISSSEPIAESDQLLIDNHSDIPPISSQHISKFKIDMASYGNSIGISPEEFNIALDCGHSFCKELDFHFSRMFIKQSLEIVFPPYESNICLDESYHKYERLAELNLKNRISTKAASLRIMQAQPFASRLFPAASSNIFLPWMNPDEELIYSTISSELNGNIDHNLLTEMEWLEIQDLGLIEGIIAEAINKFSGVNNAIEEIKEDAKIITNPAERRQSIKKSDDTAEKLKKEGGKQNKENEEKQEEEEDEEEHDEPANTLAASHKKKPGKYKHIIKGFLTSRLILMRECYRKLAYAINYFCYIKQKISLDMKEIARIQSVSCSNTEVKTGKGTPIGITESISQSRRSMEKGENNDEEVKKINAYTNLKRIF